MKAFSAAMVAVVFFGLIGGRAGENMDKEARGSGDKAGFGVERSLEVDARARDVWDLSLDVNTWPEWIPFIKRASFEGDRLEMGSTFRISMKYRGIAIPFKLTVCEYDEHKSIAWTTGSKGPVRVVRWIIFEEKGEKTLVTSREEFSGAWAKHAFRAAGEDDLKTIHDDWLRAIKAHVESQGEPGE